MFYENLMAWPLFSAWKNNILMIFLKLNSVLAWFCFTWKQNCFMPLNNIEITLIYKTEHLYPLLLMTIKVKGAKLKILKYANISVLCCNNLERKDCFYCSITSFDSKEVSRTHSSIGNTEMCTKNPIFLAKLGFQHKNLADFSEMTQEKGYWKRCKLRGSNTFLLLNGATHRSQSWKFSGCDEHGRF